MISRGKTHLELICQENSENGISSPRTWGFTQQNMGRCPYIATKRNADIGLILTNKQLGSEATAGWWWKGPRQTHGTHHGHGTIFLLNGPSGLAICSMAERAKFGLEQYSYSWGNQSCRSMAIHDTDNLGQQIVRNNDPNGELRSVTTSICIRSQEPSIRVCHVADSQRVYLQLEDPTGEDDYYWFYLKIVVISRISMVPSSHDHLMNKMNMSTHQVI